MTPKIIELKQEPVILVEFPERPVEVKDSYANGFIYKDKTGESKYLGGYCDWEDSKLVGTLSDLTEEQFVECVERINDKRYIHHPNWTRRYKTAKESFYSLLESEKVYTENPFEFPSTIDPKYYDEPYDGTGFYQELYSNDMALWEQTQQRTIDPKRTVVLLRKDTKFVTDLERQVIQNIIDSEYMSATGEQMIDFAVWSFSVTNETKQLAGALGSLIKKGFCSCDIRQGDETCALTAEGYAWAKNNGLV